jgi:DNA recombination protein RmuC
MDLLAFLTGLLAGVLVMAAAGLVLLVRFGRSRYLQGQASRDAELAQAQTELAGERQQHALVLADLQRERDQAELRQAQLALLDKQHAVLESRAEELTRVRDDLARQISDFSPLQQALRDATARSAELSARIEEQASAGAEKLAWIEQAREQLALQFQSLASAIMEQKSERFAAQNVEQVGRILEPLRDQIRIFQTEVNESRRQEGEQRAVLRSELEALRGMNQRLGEEALNLTRALRGDSRAQGAWGELVLERLLESAGLVSGREYETQVSVVDEQLARKRPDVVVRLPEGRDVVIDAKVSLTAYEKIGGCDDAAARGVLLGEHVASMRKHLNDLGERKYSELPGLQTPDFVLMFVPVEAAYLDAMRAEPTLYDRALERGVVIVSPGMLLGVLRTIKHLWRVEGRRNNAQLIAERAGLLYEKFRGLLYDIEAIAKSIENAAKTVDDARRKLTGRGNLLRQVEELKKLGARTDKELPQTLLDADSALAECSVGENDDVAGSASAD